MKRIISFVVVMLVVAGVIGATTPLFKDVRLGLDLKGGFEILYQATPTTQGEQVTRESLLQTAKSLEQRANALGTSEPEITTEGTDRIRLKIAGVTDEATVRQTMKEPAELTFRSADGCTTDSSAKKDEATSKTATESKKSDATSKSTSKDSNEVSAQSAGATQEINVDPTTGEATTAPGDTYNGAAEQDPAAQDPLKVYCKVELTGNDFTENGASISYTQLNEPQIAIKLKDASKFAEITKRLTGKNLAIFLNDQLLSAPTVQGELSDGTAVITGTYTQEEAQQLKDQINLGALPLKLTEVYSQSVGATLGQQSLKDTLLAGVIGSILILLFMALIYRVPGLIAGFCIIVHTWLLVMIFIAGDFTLTLPGIAAFILGVGMGVDANIITYERIKDELRSGKSLLSAFKAGGRNSFSTIMDANVTTIIAGAVMFALGTGAVKGFALVLILNIVVSILTNVFFSRFLLSLLLKGKIITKAKSFGVKESERSAL